MANKHILVIDDDRAVRDAFELALADNGYSIDMAEDGWRGLECAKRQRPDLVFLDLKMPGIDGVETLRRLLGHDATLKIYIVTAFSREYMAGLARAKEEGMRFQLAAKPLTLQQIRIIADASLSADGQ